VSTFRHKHLDLPRFTYQNGTTRSALDDIYLTASHSNQIRQSGILLYSLNRSDHVGTPYVIIALDRGQRTRTRLQHVRTIKVLSIKGASSEQVQQFSSHLEEQLSAGVLGLIDPLSGMIKPPMTLADGQTKRSTTCISACTKQAKIYLVNPVKAAESSIERSVSSGRRDAMVNSRWFTGSKNSRV
jgi:hypothetical protein